MCRKIFNTLSPKQQRWRTIWPAGLIALIATIQLILTFAIIGLEIASLIVDFYHSMIFAGYFCSLFFFVTWISMFTVTCCNRHSFGCATHVLVENILSIIAASVLLYFDNLFLNNPYTCFFATIDCSEGYDTYSYYNSIYDPSNYTVKLACIKAQLACAAVMLVTNVIYIAIYIFVVIKTRNRSNEVEEIPYGTTSTYPSVPPMSYQPNPQPAVIQQSRNIERIIACPTCHNRFRID